MVDGPPGSTRRTSRRRATEPQSSVVTLPIRPPSTGCSRGCATSACHWSRSLRSTPINPRRPPKGLGNSPSTKHTTKETDTMSTIRTTTGKRVPMDSLRKTALVAGVLYLITFISIPTLTLYGPVRNDPNYIVGPGPDTPVIVSGVLEIIVALACIGTAVVLYPV